MAQSLCTRAFEPHYVIWLYVFANFQQEIGKLHYRSAFSLKFCTTLVQFLLILHDQ